jgi:hypothetical protein
MTEDQRLLILDLTRDDAVRLIEAKDIGTWKRICTNIQQLAKSGELLPINVFKFYTAVSWDYQSRQYVCRDIQPGYSAAL